jgi:hypothetical protein
MFLFLSLEGVLALLEDANNDKSPPVFWSRLLARSSREIRVLIWPDRIALRWDSSPANAATSEKLSRNNASKMRKTRIIAQHQQNQRDAAILISTELWNWS